MELNNIDYDIVEDVLYNTKEVDFLYYNEELVWERKKGGDIILTLTDGTTSAVTYSDGIIPLNAFRGNEEIKSVDILDGITTVKGGSFSGCTNLTSITFSNTVLSIEASSIRDSNKIRNIIIPDSVTSIGNICFQISSLQSVVVGNGVKSIPKDFCYKCSSLTSVTLGNSVESIGDAAFYSTKIKSINIPPTVTSIIGNAFLGVPSIGTLYCNENWYNNLDGTSKSNLKNLNNWEKVWLDE